MMPGEHPPLAVWESLSHGRRPCPAPVALSTTLHPPGAEVAVIRYTGAWEVAMSVDIQIESLSVAEKVQLIESVWESLCAHPGDVQSPEWHREVLEERRRRLEDGRATIASWTDAKARLMQLGQ